MKKQNFYGGIICLILAGIVFYRSETTETESLYSVLLILLLLGVGIWNIVIYSKRENIYDEKPEENLESEFASFKEFIGEEAFHGRSGGYFTEKSTIAAEAFFASVITVGVIPEEKKEKYLFLVKEKPNRLLETFRSSNHISSYESRDPNFIFPENNQSWGKWGGAIIIDIFFTIYSFSGFPELLDEAFVCWVAWQRKRMTIDNLKVIAERRADNPYLQKLLEYCSKQ